DNSAEAAVIAGLSEESDGHVYNVVDDDLITCSDYLKLYKRQVKKLRSVRVSYFALMAASRFLEGYHKRSKGQLPAIFTPYKTATSWKGNRFDNSKLKSIGWTQIVATDEGLRRTFDDGPHPELTPRILDTLKAHRAKATFFAIGERATQYPDIIKRILAEGHTLGSHTQSHVDLSKTGFGATVRECRESREILSE